MVSPSGLGSPARNQREEVQHIAVIESPVESRGVAQALAAVEQREPFPKATVLIEHERAQGRVAIDEVLDRGGGGAAAREGRSATLDPRELGGRQPEDDLGAQRSSCSTKIPPSRRQARCALAPAPARVMR